MQHLTVELVDIDLRQGDKAWVGHKLFCPFRLPRPSSYLTSLPFVFHLQLGCIYYLNPSTLNFTKSLTTTPLIVNAAQPDEYFINVKSIRVNGTKLISFNTSLLSIDRNGVGGTKLSTITPCTILQTCIYKCLVSEFVKKALSRKIKMVASVAPFRACFSSKTMASTITRPAVASIDLVVRKGVYWRIYGANSMVRVNKDVSCLGFVDGGPHPITSVVLGGYQMEDHFLEFDLTSSKLALALPSSSTIPLVLCLELLRLLFSANLSSQ
ncbi:gamma conglutin 1-like [Camellia sinensis]|uniref:gamma conglutin 1-like n=1 Tax=Camellia sinensis TaxID=4442 RepID=UPI001035AD9F|nr:gamma conglutin 1-like [Camellia sinensis]